MAEVFETSEGTGSAIGSSFAERWLKRGTAILTSLAALIGAVYGVGVAVSKFAGDGWFGSHSAASPTAAAGFVPDASPSVASSDCAAWQQSVASSFDREYQRHEGAGYTVILGRGFASAPQAQSAAAALSDEVWGRPIFPVAVREPTRDFVVGIGFNLTRQKASDLMVRMQACYHEKVALVDPSVSLHTPRKVVE